MFVQLKLPLFNYIPLHTKLNALDISLQKVSYQYTYFVMVTLNVSNSNI